MKFQKNFHFLEQVNHSFFLKRLQSNIKSKNEIDLEKHLLKFEQFKEKEDLKIRKSLENIQISEIKNKETLKNKLIAKAKNFSNFNKASEKKGFDFWKENIIFSKEREKRDLDFQLKEANQNQIKIFNSLKFSESDMKNKISNFENVIKNNYLIENETEENSYNKKNNCYNEENINNLKVTYKSSLNRKKIVLDKFLNEIRQKAFYNPTCILERERRRRKMIVDLNKAYKAYLE